MNALGRSMKAMYLLSYAYMIQENSTASVDTVGELEYYLVMKYLLLFTPATVLTLIVLSLFT